MDIGGGRFVDSKGKTVCQRDESPKSSYHDSGRTSHEEAPLIVAISIELG